MLPMSRSWLAYIRWDEAPDRPNTWRLLESRESNTNARLDVFASRDR